MRLPTPRSYWADGATPPDRHGVGLPRHAEVVVVGAGIAGLTTAFLLAQRGIKVAVLESDDVAGGVTGHATAKVTAQHDLIYGRLLREQGLSATRLYGQVQREALKWIAATVDELGIDCGFVRADSFLYTCKPDRRLPLAREANAAQQAELPATYEDDIAALPFPVEGAVRFANQAIIHPRQWLLGLADHVERLGGVVVEGVRATGLRDSHSPIVHTSHGDVDADDVVVTTHYPVFDRGLFFARLDPVRELAVAGPVGQRPALPDMYLDIDDHHSARCHTNPDTGRSHLIVIGEPYRTGERVDVEARFQRLARWARTSLGLRRVSHRWSAHDLATPDRVPYVGRYHVGASHLWVATGFGQWGMTGGTAAGRLLVDLVTGMRSPAQEKLFDPARVALRSTPRALRTNAVVAKHLGVDSARALLDPTHPADLKPDAATVTRVGAKLVAAYREPTGQLHAVSARCTHLGCVVNFNNAERSWDCPCHASRFGLDGEVLHGPAVQPLPPVSLDDAGTTHASGDIHA